MSRILVASVFLSGVLVLSTCKSQEPEPAQKASAPDFAEVKKEEAKAEEPKEPKAPKAEVSSRPMLKDEGSGAQAAPAPEAKKLTSYNVSVQVMDPFLPEAPGKRHKRAR